MGRIVPLADVGVRVARIHQLVLLDDVFTSVVFEVLDVQHLRVGVVVHARYRGVGRIGHVDDVHVVPAGEVGVGLAVGRGGHLNFSVAGGC